MKVTEATRSGKRNQRRVFLTVRVEETCGERQLRGHLGRWFSNSQCRSTPATLVENADSRATSGPTTMSSLCCKQTPQSAFSGSRRLQIQGLPRPHFENSTLITSVNQQRHHFENIHKNKGFLKCGRWLKGRPSGQTRFTHCQEHSPRKGKLHGKYKMRSYRKF